MPGAETSSFSSSLSTSPDQISEWVRSFHEQGYLFIENVLNTAHIDQLKKDLDWALAHFPSREQDPNSKISGQLVMRMFEHSPANLSLFDLEPIVSFAEAVIPKCHVIHNNSFITPPGGGITTWHQDDAPHYLVTDGQRPTNVHLPVLFFTCNYYLTDVTEVDHGSTETIPGSHLFGADVSKVFPTAEWETYKEQIHPNLGKAGSVILFNNQVWHRGGPNNSSRHRYITQITYGRRMIGHKYYPFMNYQMPEHIYRGADARRKRLLGFLDRGAYG
ncbi:MAG: phytanoyl-CoA dioxygenase family protein [bacterium]|nr:phytanoyl-CoA dioxygenase family protein [bacterium]